MPCPSGVITKNQQQLVFLVYEFRKQNSQHPDVAERSYAEGKGGKIDRLILSIFGGIFQSGR